MREKELEIRVLDNETLHKFHATIGDQFFGNQNQFFTSYFESPEDVFTHLTENFSQVVLENGVLRFNYTIGKKQQVKEVVVELVKEEVDDNSLAHLKIAKMKEHFTAQIQQKESQIVDLSKELRELAN